MNKIKNDFPMFELKISEDVNNESEVSFISLVDAPAIEKDFMVFNKEQFIEPKKNERKDDFLPRCIKYVIGEGKDSPQAVAICNSLWDQHFAGEKISFDYDGTLSTSEGQKLAKEKISQGYDVYIISARNHKTDMYDMADKLGIPHSKVYATGSNTEKISKIKELNIVKHYDNNPDVIKQIGKIGQKFIKNYSSQFQIVSEEQHIISGPIMLANTPIYRFNEQIGEHYVFFSPETIKEIAIKYSKKNYNNNVNLMHDHNMVVDGVTLFESFIVDKTRGILPMKGFENVPDGSWFGSFYIENPDVWDYIKNGTFKGFSVEGLFKMEENKLPNNMDDDKDVINLLQTINEILKNKPNFEK